MALIRKEQHQTPLKTIIDELKDGFCTIEVNGDFIYLNPIATEMFELMNGVNSSNFYEDIIRDTKNIKYIKNVLVEFGFIKDYEVEIYSKNNKKFPVLLSLNNILDPHEEVVGLSILIKDMTYIKKVQQQLLQAQKLESIGMLASGIAHEFNNILTGIIPNAELIKMTVAPDNPNHNRASSIQKSATRAADIVKKLLSFSRDDKKEADQISNINVIANETIDILKKLLDKNIEIAANIPGDLYSVKIDSTRLQQLIMNLSINARDAIAEQGEIIISAENIIIKTPVNAQNQLPEGKYVLLKISDSGQGIPERYLNKIFDPFFTTKEPGKGTGLGLSIIYGIVKNVNGKIEVQSKLGEGTTFSIYLPASDKDLDEVSADINVDIGDKNKTILIVDDEAMIREMARDMLTTIGYKVYVCDNGNDGIELFKEKFNEIDLVLLDLIMPKMNGVTTYEKLKDIKENIKVIISSGVGDLDKKKELHNLGVTGFLEKPYSLKSMSDSIDRILSLQ